MVAKHGNGTLVVLMLFKLLSAVPGAGQTEVLQVSVAGAGSGTVTSDAPAFSCGALCSYAVPSGVTVILTAHPAPGSEFVNWGGDCSGTAPTCSLSMNATAMAIASFKPEYDPYTVRHWFLPAFADGQQPYKNLLPFGGYLYGMTCIGGRAGGGTIFRELPDGSEHTVLHDFTRVESDGAWSYGSLTDAGGRFYGMTNCGGSSDQGTIFEIDPDGGGFKVLHSFTGYPDGGSPAYGTLIESEGWLFGMTAMGGADNQGIIFKISLTGADYQIIHSFAAGTSDGSNPYDSLIISEGMLYGMTRQGGASGWGTIFRLKTDGSEYQLLHSFSGGASDGRIPIGSLIILDNVLYGMTVAGGTKDQGTIFRIKPDGSDFQILHSFVGYPGDGQWPEGSLICSGNELYGTAYRGGSIDYGIIFKFNLADSGYQVLHSFAAGPGDGHHPCGSLSLSGGVLYGMTNDGGADDLGVIFQIAPDGGGYHVNHSFGSHGAGIRWAPGTLIVSDGVFYGLTSGSGIANKGTVFKINPDGTGMQVLHEFGGYPADGSWPQGSLFALDGVFYGMTSGGGTSGIGTIFKIHPDGSAYQCLHSFLGGVGDGSYPFGSLTAAGAILYGMTQGGGSAGNGIAYRLQTDGGGFQVLHSFEGYPSDGAVPYGSLLSFSGGLFGMTNTGCTNGSGLGTIFKMDTDGNGYQILHSFDGSPDDGGAPNGSLIASGGRLYGLTYQGGIWDCGTIFGIDTGGTNYQVIRSFTGNDGFNPNDSLLDFDGMLYGMTQYGGVGGQGTIFQIHPDGGDFHVVHPFFGSPTDGAYACGSLLAHEDLLYGMTMMGGLNNNGVLFSLRIQPLIAGTVTLGGVGLAGVNMSGLPGNPVTDSNGKYSAIIPNGWSGTVTPMLADHLFTPASRSYSSIVADQTAQDYTAILSPGPPPVNWTGAGAALFTKGSGDTLNVTYDASTCAAEKLIILYGNIGSWSGYAGCAQDSGGNSGATIIDSAGQTDVWYNLVWTNGTTAGHPGFAFDGTQSVARTWPVGTFCGMAADNASHPTCP